MLNIKIITVGTLKEAYWRDGVNEYLKRLNAFCTPEIVQLKEAPLSSNPSDSDIASVIEEEGKAILAAIPKRSAVVTLCIEGKQLSSEEFAEWIDNTAQTSATVTFIIGGSYGLSDKVKQLSDLRLSFSKMTFPHQMMRLVLLEAIYRGFNIIKGTKYHK